MPRRRRVGNLLALAVLAALAERPMHPYEIAAHLRSRGKDQDMAVKWGSLYTVMGNLAKHGLVEEAGSERSGARPERTVYRITDDGREEILDWVRELVGEPGEPQPRFVAGLSLLAALGPEEAAELLRRRLHLLDADVAAQRALLEHHRASTPRLFLVEDEYLVTVREAEAEWVRGLLAELAGGTFPGIAEWREHHERRGPTES
jgi:DNA-binding PadR family transcriptional regulator